MKVIIVGTGTLKNRPEKILFDEFYQRLIPQPIIQEILLKPTSTPQQEAQLISGFIKPEDIVIALTEEGEPFTTLMFVSYLNNLEIKGNKRCLFIIGGPDGLDNKLKQRANLCLSLSRMTWSHLLARVLLIEQLYRYQQIQRGHPYHR